MRHPTLTILLGLTLLAGCDDDRPLPPVPMAIHYDEMLVIGVETARMDEVDGFDLVLESSGRHVIETTMLGSISAPPGMPTTHSWMAMRAEDYPACEDPDPDPATILTVWTWTYDSIWLGDENDKKSHSLTDPPHIEGARWMGAPSDPVEIPWLAC